MFQKMPIPANPPKDIYPSISIYENFLDEKSWATLDWYVRNTDKETWGFTKSMEDRPPTATRFHTVKHSKNNSIEVFFVNFSKGSGRGQQCIFNFSVFSGRQTGPARHVFVKSIIKPNTVGWC